MRTIRIMIPIIAFDKLRRTIDAGVTREHDGVDIAAVLLGCGRINYNTGDKGLS
jgi:hypothetical protein